ncbi:MAG: hypothetical protein M0Z40_14390 [Actinomycetota bacterium]|nr:hypothetical protein [Actinomycetota bacterium]
MSTDEKIKTALERLVAGELEEESRRLTVGEFCAKVGVSRASLYRSAHVADVRRLLAGTDRPPSPSDAEHLQARVRELTEAEARIRSERSAEVRELRATVRTYANQIQLLTLRLSQLEEDNRQLLASLASAGNNVAVLPHRS